MLCFTIHFLFDVEVSFVHPTLFWTFEIAYLNMCECVYMSVHVYTCTYECLHVFARVYMCVHVWMCLHVCRLNMCTCV